MKIIKLLATALVGGIGVSLMGGVYTFAEFIGFMLIWVSAGMYALYLKN